jgi:YegS/Rv2252/BmrU family lipid kinase
MNQEKPIILFVINPVSGGIEKNDYEQSIKKQFDGKQDNLRFLKLTGKSDLNELKKQIEKTVPQTVVAVGGDGTVSLVAKALLDTDIQLGIIPAGSSNGMARELEIPIDIPASIGIIKRNSAKKVDVLEVNNQVCLHLSDIGLNAQLVKHFENGKGRGKWGYAKVAFRVFFRKQRMRATINTDKEEIKRHAFMIVIANASKYGTGAVINPDGKLSDGLFEVVIMRKISLPTLYKMWFKPNAFTNDQIEVFQAKTVTIETLKKVHFQVDGEYLGKVQRVRAEIMPEQLNILLP